MKEEKKTQKNIEEEIIDLQAEEIAHSVHLTLYERGNQYRRFLFLMLFQSIFKSSIDATKLTITHSFIPSPLQFSIAKSFISYSRSAPLEIPNQTKCSAGRSGLLKHI